jgi:signal transduction histidine kinase
MAQGAENAQMKAIFPEMGGCQGTVSRGRDSGEAMNYRARSRGSAGSGGARRNVTAAAGSGLHARVRTNPAPQPEASDEVTGRHVPPGSAPATRLGLHGPGPRSPASSTDSFSRRRGRLSRYRVRDWRLRSRLLLLIAIPTLAAVILGGVRIASSVQSALAFQRAEERAVLASDISQLARGLETERDQTLYYIALGVNGRAGELSRSVSAATKSNAMQHYRAIQAFHRQTDQTVRQFRAGLAAFPGAYPAGARLVVDAALAKLDSLPNLRQAATKTQMPGLIVFQKYTDLLGSLFQVEDQTAAGTADPALSQAVGVLSLVSRIMEEASEQRAILSAALQQGRLGDQEAAALNRAAANQQGTQQTFDLSATTPQRVLWNNTVSGSFVYLAASEEQQAASLQARTHSLTGDPITADAFYDAMTNGINNQMGSAEQTLANDVIARSNSLRERAVTSALIVGAAVLAFLALALVLTVMVARSMVDPLRRLRRGAIEVAGVVLPRTVRWITQGDVADVSPEVTPIDVDSTDEIGDVARAFDRVHSEAVRLASNEAALRDNVNAMFVNLSRRSQSLVERQIRLIDEMEQGEQDAEQLGSLFQLDHLATRMRRNSENLLVLAGHEVHRAGKQAVPLVDVLRAAVSEIEQYERVSLSVQPGTAVRGTAVYDVVHLVSELVENATSFSAGDTPVTVQGELLSSGGVLLDITDQGVGMGADEMAHANWRLDNPPEVDVTVSRRMGLYVVARLAARHGIRVRLRSATMGGLTALVWLPDEVISQENGGARYGLRDFESPGHGAIADPLGGSGDPLGGSGDPLGGSARPARDDLTTTEPKPAAHGAGRQVLPRRRPERGRASVLPEPFAAVEAAASGAGTDDAADSSVPSSGGEQPSVADEPWDAFRAPQAASREHT